MTETTTAPRGRTVYLALPALRSQREATGRSLRHLAGHVGISPSHLSRIELGTKRTTTFIAMSIAKQLDAAVSDLFELTRTRN